MDQNNNAKSFKIKHQYETIVTHRQKFSKVAGVNYNTHNPKTINPIPPPDIINIWKADYTKMQQDMIYEKNQPTFENLINNLQELRTNLQVVKWSFELKFPISNQ